MQIISKFQLPIFTKLLEDDRFNGDFMPKIIFDKADVIVKIIGYNCEGEDKYETILRFKKVRGVKIASSGLAEKFYGNFDEVIEIIESEWLNFYKKKDFKMFEIYKPKHYVLTLWEDAQFELYEFIATDFIVEKSEIVE